MKRLLVPFSEVDAWFRRRERRATAADGKIVAQVRRMVADVARRGDAALFDLTERFDGYTLDERSVAVSPEEWEEALRQVPAETFSVLKLAARRIAAFHRRQRPAKLQWAWTDRTGVCMGQRLLPLRRVGVYAPGGQACYPSTVLMAAIPARLAGVAEIILVTPTRGGVLPPLMAAAARLGGVHRIFRIGGAQAIAALAYGTASVPAVDKIVGPGNAYVAAAKQLVFGRVGIDMIAGPSEIVIIADATARAPWIAADMLAQAEHDALARAILLTPEAALAYGVIEELGRQLRTLPKQAVARRALRNQGAVIVTENLDQAVSLANRIAPEHLELLVRDPRALLARVRSAGAIFLGPTTPEVLADYVAGVNHILPTGGTARFSSPLGVYDFFQRTNVLSVPPEAFARLGPPTELFARCEGLEGHARSAAIRKKT